MALSAAVGQPVWVGGPTTPWFSLLPMVVGTGVPFPVLVKTVFWGLVTKEFTGSCAWPRLPVTVDHPRDQVFTLSPGEETEEELRPWGLDCCRLVVLPQCP